MRTSSDARISRKVEIFMKRDAIVKKVMSAVFAIIIAISCAGSVFAADIKELTAAAEAGDANAQRELGVAYSNGVGVEQDYAKAAELFLKAAEQGHAVAQYDLASMYNMGFGVKKDFVTAYMWMTVAAMTDPNNQEVKELREMAAMGRPAAKIEEAESKAKAKFEEIVRRKK